MDESCPNCGEYLSGDGYGTPERCPNALEERWWYTEPDSGPYYCLEEEEWKLLKLIFPKKTLEFCLC